MSRNPYQHESTDLEAMCINFDNYISRIVEDCSEVKNKRNAMARFPEWASDLYIKLVPRKDVLYAKHLKMKANMSVLDEYKKCSNKVRDLGRRLKKQYYDSRIDLARNNSRATWKILNEMLKREGSGAHPIILKNINETLSNPNDVANAFNDYFVTAAVKPYDLKNLDKIKIVFYR